MDLLDDYLQSNFLVDQRELVDLEVLIGQVSQTLVDSFHNKWAWPHRIGDGGEPRKPKLSHFSTALITVTLCKLLDMWERPAWRGIKAKFPPPVIAAELLTNVQKKTKRATHLLLHAITSAQEPNTRSRTYGDDDPFTLSYLNELTWVRGELDNQQIQPHVHKSIGAHVGKQREKLYRTVAPRTGAAATPSAIWKQHQLYKMSDSNTRVISNAMIAIRVVQTLRSRPKGLAQSAPLFRDYFETTLHQQLSYSSIPDSRFDPAELVFSLEGLLLVQKNAVDRTLFARVVEVLRNAQAHSAFWRPVKPFLATDKGMALFPVSVEVANSLIRSCELFDGSSLHNTFSSECAPLFHRYFQWLQARTVRLDYGNREAIGWHSEHVNETGAIHSWETSLVLEFLIDYRRLLQAHMARQLLVLSRVSMHDPRAVGLADKQDPSARPASQRKKRAEDNRLLKDLRQDEPVNRLGDHYRVLKRIREDFAKGWLSGKPQNYSMLLYGPPGTGKTTIAKNLCKVLGFNLITVTVSDFLAAGDAQLESRAKAIFTMLAAQPACVVLFDEIDHFLLNRESARYRHQATTFQFMTPGMLTKIHDLRSSQRVIFIIATNYENRIDSAIKRTGRIDQHCLLLPLDAETRIKLINKELAGSGKRKIADRQLISRLKSASIFLGRGDISNAVRQAVKQESSTGALRIKLIGNLMSARRAADIASYTQRLGDEQDSDQPLEELVCLLGLVVECGPGFRNDNIMNDIAKLRERLNTDLAGIRTPLDAKASKLNPAIRSRIAALIGKPPKKTDKPPNMDRAAARYIMERLAFLCANRFPPRAKMR